MFKKKIFYMIIIIIVLIPIIFIIKNQFNANFEKLPESDQKVLMQYNKFYDETQNNDIWENYDLRDKTILAIHGKLGEAYLINPKNKINSVFIKEVKMPKECSLKVYRVSNIDPQILKLAVNGNFNTINEKYKIHGEDVYFIRYNEESIDKKFSSKHFITFLSHEAFHYYMQEKWAEGVSYDISELSVNGKKLLFDEYDILQKIQKELLTNKDKNTLLKYAKEYIDVVNKRIVDNKIFMKNELDRELVEGTATYVSIKASNLTGYDYGVMYFDNVKNVMFSDVKKQIELGNINENIIETRMPYETGALLCELIDTINIPNWQGILNKQTMNKRTNLFEILENHLSY